MRGLKRLLRTGGSVRGLSHLLQMRGLKHFVKDIVNPIKVASFTDAWIETIYILAIITRVSVASFTDAWIETGYWDLITTNAASHLLQMRGLKRF